MLMYFLLVHLSSTAAEEQVIAIDHMGLVLEDAFNNSYLANQGYKGRNNNDTFYSGQTIWFPLYKKEILLSTHNVGLVF